MKNYTIVALLFFICGACSGVRVSTDYNPDYDFSQFRTYAWFDNGKEPSSDTRINNDLVVDRVRHAVETALAAHGFVKTDAESADFQVSWHGAIEKKLQVDSIDHFYSPYGYGPFCRAPFMAETAIRSTTIREYEVGTLIIDILDPVQHKLLWRGSGSDRIRHEADPEKAIIKINEAVAAILNGFPPAKQ